MKRILSLLLALTLVFSLVACGNEKDTSSDIDTSTHNTTQSDTESTDDTSTESKGNDPTDENSSVTETPSNNKPTNTESSKPTSSKPTTSKPTTNSNSNTQTSKPTENSKPTQSTTGNNNNDNNNNNNTEQTEQIIYGEDMTILSSNFTYQSLKAKAQEFVNNNGLSYATPGERGHEFWDGSIHQFNILGYPNIEYTPEWPAKIVSTPQIADDDNYLTCDADVYYITMSGTVPYKTKAFAKQAVTRDIEKIKIACGKEMNAIYLGNNGYYWDNTKYDSFDKIPAAELEKFYEGKSNMTIFYNWSHLLKISINDKGDYFTYNYDFTIYFDK